MEVKLMAGEMASLCNISKQTLLYYDKIGLFKPCEINEETGYRYYSLMQSEELDVILCLKNLGMSLKEIRGYLDRTSPAERIELLEHQQKIIQQKIDEIQKTGNRIESIITSLKSRLTIHPFDMGIRWMEKIPVACMEIKPPNDLYAFDLTIKELLQERKDLYDGNISDMLVFVDHTSDKEYFFQKIAFPAGHDSDEYIPEGKYGYIYHKGPFDKLVESYQILTSHIESLNYRPTGLAIERMLIDVFAAASESDYLIEMLIPVEKK